MGEAKLMGVYPVDWLAPVTSLLHTIYLFSMCGQVVVDICAPSSGLKPQGYASTFLATWREMPKPCLPTIVVFYAGRTFSLLFRTLER